MKKFVLLLLLVSIRGYSQGNSEFCGKINRILNLVRKEHFSPKPIDDSLSVFVFDAFMDGMDAYRNTFSKAEYERLAKLRLSIDDRIRKDDCSFVDEFASVYKNALERKVGLLNKISHSTIDYTTIDTVRFSRNNFPFDMKEAEQERVLRKRIKTEVLEEISKMSDNLDSLKINFVSIEKKVSPKIFETNLCRISGVLNDKVGFKTKLQNDFLNILCTYFDPHSNYFTMDARSSFMSMLSTSNLSLGIIFGMNEKEELVVDEVIPGGPAARSEKIEKDDILIKVVDKDGNGYTVSCSSLDAVGDMIYSDANNELKLTVKKKNGTMQEVSLQKQVMNAEENSVISFIAEKNVRVGYIKIPSFYSDFEGDAVKGVADDAAKQIFELQQEHIQGLVIDLQDNGGGSMDEGERLAGLFIGTGPIAILADSKGRQTVLKDPIPGSIYTGPIVILINGQSASASEFFTSAMQDYKRAFVIGSPSSGKASMQSIIPLDGKTQSDYVKLTLEKFYRITGESCQITGVIPDVPMPMIFDSIVPREKSLKNALKNDRLNAKLKFSEYPSSNNNDLFSISRERVKHNKNLAEIALLNNEINLWYSQQKKPMPLTLDEFFKDVHENDLLWKKIKTIEAKPTECIIKNTSVENEKISASEFEKEINEFQIKDAQSNPYLDEAVNIISDYYKLRN